MSDCANATKGTCKGWGLECVRIVKTMQRLVLFFKRVTEQNNRQRMSVLTITLSSLFWPVIPFVRFNVRGKPVPGGREKAGESGLTWPSWVLAYLLDSGAHIGVP